MTQKPSNTLTQVLWAAVCSGTLLYTYVVFTLARVTPPFDAMGMLPDLSQGIEIAMAGITVVTLAMQAVIPRLIRGPGLRPGIAATAYVIRLALWEMVAVYGMALAFLVNNPWKYLPYLFLSLLGLLFHFPKK